MFIQGALRNVKRGVATDEFLRFVAERAPGEHYFMVEPPPGISMTAAIDWRIVMRDPAAIAPLAAALWSGYETFIEPLRKGEATSSAGIYIQMKNEKGQFDQFMVAADIADEKALINRMEESARILSPRNKGGDSLRGIDETGTTDYWVRMNV